MAVLAGLAQTVPVVAVLICILSKRTNTSLRAAACAVWSKPNRVIELAAVTAAIDKRRSFLFLDRCICYFKALSKMFMLTLTNECT